jgi:hypothetical protein
MTCSKVADPTLELAPVRTPMILQDAHDLTPELLDARIRPLHGPDVVICSCTEHPSAWVFGYNTRRLLQEGDLLASLVGNGPVVVPKSGSAPFFGLSAFPDRGATGDL